MRTQTRREHRPLKNDSGYGSLGWEDMYKGIDLAMILEECHPFR